MSDELESLRAEVAALRSRVALFESATSLVSLGEWERDLDTDLGTWSEELRRIYGFPAGSEPISRERFLAAIHPEDRAEIERRLAELVSSDASAPLRCRHRIVRPTGEVRWLEACVLAIRGPDGRVIRLLGTARDRTDEHRADEERRASDAAYRSIFEQARDAILVASAEGRWLDANPSACALLGYSREELLSMNIADVVPSEGHVRGRAEREALAAGGSLRILGKLRRKDGSTVSVELAASRLSDGRLLGIARDVTERERIAQALEEHHQTLRELTGNLPALVWIRTLESGELLYASEAWERFLGRPPVIGESFAQLAGAVHPEDLESVRAGAEQVLVGNGYEDIVRFRTPDGTVAWMHMRAFAVRNAQGVPQRVCGIAMDVTQLWAADLAIRQSEEKYRNLFEHAGVGIFRSRIDGTEILDVNARFCEIFRGRYEDFVSTPGTDWWVDPEARRAAVGELLRAGVVRDFEATMRARDGSRLRILVSAVVYPSLGYLEGSMVDITERAEAEARVRTALAEKEVLLREIHHRVKNNLQVVSSLLYLQANRVDDPLFSAHFRASQSRISAMALVHHMLYESTDLSHVPLTQYVHALGRSLFESHGVASQRVVLHIEPSELVVDLDVAVPCGLVLNELLTNALRHAFPGETRGTIDVAIEACGDRLCRLVVSDDGVGLPPDFETRRAASLGTKLIERLVVQMRGTIVRTASARGTRHEILFPCATGHAEPVLTDALAGPAGAEHR